jgi:pyrrolidone-carboxylate peptidase
MSEAVMTTAAEPDFGSESEHPDDRRLLICGFQPVDGAAADATERAMAQLALADWAPAGVTASYFFAPQNWTTATEAIADMMRASRAGAVLLVATARRSSDFAVEMRAQNRVSITKPDSTGQLRPSGRIASVGPAVARATAPVADMLHGLLDAGLKAHASSEAGDYICNYVLYRLLTEVAAESGAPPVGCLRAPSLGADGQLLDAEDQQVIDHIAKGVMACANVVADFIPGLREPAGV